MGNDLSELMQRTLGAAHWELIQRVADEAARLKMQPYLVGGSVRDLLLRLPINDLDIVVEGDAIKLARTLAKTSGGKATTHPKFGTATWSFNSSVLDLITARSEIYDHPGSLPSVKFSTIDDDLRRRDFTINAMAVRLGSDHIDELLDPLGGKDDLAHRLIRTLHPRSFLDDPTRMLRAVRYAARYGFAIESETLHLFTMEARSVLSQLSGERLRYEFDLIFEENEPSIAFFHLAELDLLRPVHPMLPSLIHQLPALVEPPASWGDFKLAGMLSIRQTLGWLCWLLPLPEMEIESITKRLAFPSTLAKAARAASALFVDLSTFTNAKPSQWTFHLDDFPALAVYAVYLRTQEPALKEYLENWRHVRPNTSGDDLKARGLPPGPDYQHILSRLRVAWLEGEVTTANEELKMLEKLLKEE